MLKTMSRILLIDTPLYFFRKINSMSLKIDLLNLFTSGPDKLANPYHEYDYIAFSPAEISPNIFRSYNRQNLTYFSRISPIQKAVESGTLVIIFIHKINWEGDNRKNRKKIEPNIYKYFCNELVINPLIVPHNQSGYFGENDELRMIFKAIDKFGCKPICSTLNIHDPFLFWSLFPLTSNKVGDRHSIILRRGKGAIVVLPEYKNNAAVINSIIESSYIINNLTIETKSNMLNQKYVYPANTISENIMPHMSNTENVYPKVFISYSHDSQEHADCVLALSDQLRSDGINCILDQYEMSPPEGWPNWMDQNIRDANFVLMICTEIYYRRIMHKEITGKGLGVKWEGKLIYTHMYYDDTRNAKFIPVIFKPDDRKYIPDPLKDATYYCVDSDQSYEDLYRILTNQPRVTKPKLGKLRKLHKLQRSSDYSLLLEKPSHSLEYECEEENLGNVYVLALDIISSSSSEQTNKMKEIVRGILEENKSKGLKFEDTGNDVFVACAEDPRVLWDVALLIRNRGEDIAVPGEEFGGTRKALYFGSVVAIRKTNGETLLHDLTRRDVIPSAFSLVDGIDKNVEKEKRNSVLIIAEQAMNLCEKSLGIDKSQLSKIQVDAKHFHRKAYIVELK